MRPPDFNFPARTTIGLCGGHRTGKSTAARTLANYGWRFVKTDTTEVFRRFNLKPSDQLSFATRLEIQNSILASYEQAFTRADGVFVTDRTPLDLIAYTLADIQGATKVDFDKLSDYIARCFASTNRFFTHLIILQPGIPLIYADGKAALNQAYIEHLNTLIIGACYDERNHVTVLKMPRQFVDLERRVKAIIDFVKGVAPTG